MSDLPDNADLAGRIQLVLAEAAADYRSRLDLDSDATINVLAPRWAIDLYREAFDGVPHVVIEPFDDVIVDAPHDHLTLHGVTLDLGDAP